MTGYGVPDGDMPDSLTPPPWGSQPFDERDLDALLAGNMVAVPVALRQVADILTALQAAPSDAETRGEAAARAEFRARHAPRPEASEEANTPLLPARTDSRPPHRRRRNQGNHRTPARSRRPKAALALSAVAFAAIAVIGVAAAYSGKLPGAVSAALATHSAKDGSDPAASSAGTDGSAKALPTSSATAATKSPVPTYGASAPARARSGAAQASSLCDAFVASAEHLSAHQLWWETPTYTRLSAAAGGPKNVPGYCAAAWRKLFAGDNPKPVDWPPVTKAAQGAGDTGDAGNQPNGQGSSGGVQDQGNLGSDTGSKVSGRLTGPDWPLETGSDAAPPVGPGR